MEYFGNPAPLGSRDNKTVENLTPKYTQESPQIRFAPSGPIEPSAMRLLGQSLVIPNPQAKQVTEKAAINNTVINVAGK